MAGLANKIVKGNTLDENPEEEESIEKSEMKNELQNMFESSNLTDFNSINSNMSNISNAVDIKPQRSKRGPLPEPPLAKINLGQAPKLIDIGYENWDEGSDTKHKAYNWIRNEKEKMFD